MADFIVAPTQRRDDKRWSASLLRVQRWGMFRAGAKRIAVCAFTVLAAACTRAEAPAAMLDPAKVASVVIGRSSRTDVFAALGQPAHTEESRQGETWVYETQSGGTGHQQLSNGAGAAAGVVGAFVPYVGLLGSGLGLASATMGSERASPRMSSLKVIFSGSGVVSDCLYTSTDVPAGLPGATVPVIGCQRPRI